MGMHISHDTEAEAWYVQIGDGPVARTVHISDDVAVDLDDAGGIYGLEVLCPPETLTPAERAAILEQFPAAGDALAELDRHAAGLTAA